MGPNLSPDDAIKLANAGQELLRKDFLSGAVMLELVVILLLAAWVIWLQQKLGTQADRHAAKLEAIGLDARNVIVENGRTLFTLARFIEEGIPPSKRRHPSPVLTPEPISRVSLPPPKEPPP